MRQIDYLERARGAALGARLRRLSEAVDRDASRTYSLLDINFEQRWFGILDQIVINGPMAVSDIAEALKITHVSVSQSRKSLVKAGYVTSISDTRDSRRKLIHLTEDGKKLAKKLGPLWDALKTASVELNEESGGLVELIDQAEAALERQSIYDRVEAMLASK